MRTLSGYVSRTARSSFLFEMKKNSLFSIVFLSLLCKTFANHLSIFGDAIINSSVIQLTPNAGFKAGAAFISTPFNLATAQSIYASFTYENILYLYTLVS